MLVRLPRVRYDVRFDNERTIRELEASWYAVYPEGNPHAVFGV